jgi:hypothetical protein
MIKLSHFYTINYEDKKNNRMAKNFTIILLSENSTYSVPALAVTYAARSDGNQDDRHLRKLGSFFLSLILLSFFSSVAAISWFGVDDGGVGV